MCSTLLSKDTVATAFHAFSLLLSSQAKESIDQLVYLCRTDKDEVREAAKQALLMLGNGNNAVLFLFTSSSIEGCIKSKYC